MEGQLLGAGFGTPFIVSQESAAASKVTLTSLNSSLASNNSKSTNASVDEPMLDWKSLEFLGLVEEYVSAVIKGEKMPSSSSSGAAAAAAAAAASMGVTTTATSHHAAVASSYADSLASYDAAAAAVLSDAAAAALPHVRYATSGSPEVIFSGVKSATPTYSPADASATSSQQQRPMPSTLYVMKNVGPNGGAASPSDVGTAHMMATGPLGTSGTSGTTTMGPLGTAMAPIGSLGGVASLGDLASFLPVGTTLFASPIGVDGTQALQYYTVREDGSIIQPVLTQAPIQTLSANGHPNLDFSVANDYNYHPVFHSQVDYMVNDDLSRDGVSPNDSFESSSLSLSVGDPSPSSDEGVGGRGGGGRSGDNLNDVIILSQTQPHSLSIGSSGALLGSSHSPSPTVAGLSAAMGLTHSHSGSSSPLTMLDVNSLVQTSSLSDPSVLNRIIPSTFKQSQPQPRRQQQQQQQSSLQQQLQQRQDSSPMNISQQRPIGQSASSLLNPAAASLVAKALHNGNTSLMVNQQQQQSQGLSVQGLSTQQGIQTMGMASGDVMMTTKGGVTKVKSRRSQTKQIPEESLPFPCDVCGRRFVSMHSVKRHMAIHDLDRPWKCEVCHKCFKQQAHLYSHKFTHTGSKPFECTMCHKSFNVKSNLHRHEKEVCKVPLESRTPTRSKS